MEFTRGLSRDATVTARKGERVPEAIAFGERVRQLREVRRWTQERLAEAAGLTPVQLSRIENGANEPKLTTILRLARALGARPGELLDHVRHK